VRPGKTADLAAVRWIHGLPDGGPSGDPPLQVVALDDSTFVIPQGKQVHVEARFLSGEPSMSYSRDASSGSWSRIHG
jgi:hypothetical protein